MRATHKKAFDLGFDVGYETGRYSDAQSEIMGVTGLIAFFSKLQERRGPTCFVVIAAICLWRMRTRLSMSLEEHLKNPEIYCVTEYEKDLARHVAAYVTENINVYRRLPGMGSE
jgi:hypothetical protein